MNKLKPEDVPATGSHFISFGSGLSYQGKKNEVIKRFVGTFVRLCCHIIYVNIVFIFVLELKTA